MFYIKKTCRVQSALIQQRVLIIYFVIFACLHLFYFNRCSLKLSNFLPHLSLVAVEKSTLISLNVLFFNSSLPLLYFFFLNHWCPSCVFWICRLQMEVEQLLSLSGSALAQAVSALLETPGLYVFSDILELPNVREVSVLYFCIFSISGLFVRVLFLVRNIKNQFKSQQ